MIDKIVEELKDIQDEVTLVLSRLNKFNDNLEKTTKDEIDTAIKYLGDARSCLEVKISRIPKYIKMNK